MDNNTQERIIKSSQEQAVASWITYRNQLRLDSLVEALNQQDLNLSDALSELAELKSFIGDPSQILGSDLTKHGEIAEHMQVNISNARRAIQGLSKEYTFEGVGRTAPEDYLKNGLQVQSKFYNGLKQTFFNHHGLEDHLKTYPEFVIKGGSYDIPQDQYNQMIDILEKLHNEPSKLSTSDYHLAKRLDEFLKTNNLQPGKDITSAVEDYADVQKNVANQTINNEENSLKTEDAKRRKAAYDASNPTIKEGLEVVGKSAVIEAGVTFCMSVAKKRKEKSFHDFTEEDWAEIGLDTGKSGIKGGIRGGSVYILTNFTATPANVASSYVTAAFGVVEQVKALKKGEVSQEDFVINCETVCLDVTVSAIASLAGQTIIPIPGLGAVIGNVAGEFIYEICKSYGSKKSAEIIKGYEREMAELNQQLDIKLYQLIIELQESMQRFKSLELMAFDLDINRAYLGSIQLALELGVDEKKALKTKEEIDRYFLS